MAVSSPSSELEEKILRYQPENLAEIIEKLVGDKDNLKIDVQEVRFSVGKTQYEISGAINFNVIHKNPTAHAKIKEL